MAADVAIDSIENLKARFARLTADAAKESIAARGAFSIAVPGGSAAELLLPSLAGAPIDWARVTVFFVDERCVPSDDPASNYGAARSAWLDRLPLGANAVHRMPAEAPDVEAAAAGYARILENHAGLPVRLDLVLLGVGADGHVASLFPGHRLLRVWDRDVALLDDAPKPPAGRMTLTLRVLTAARRLVIFASGPAKADAIADALGDAESDLPAALVTMGDAEVTFLLDEDAGSRLRHRMTPSSP